MCGIVGYSGKENAVDILLDKLQYVEYRGYDSAGLSVLNKNKIVTIKECGGLNNLINKVKKNKPIGFCGIAHTRWATHGKPSRINAHPHNSKDNSISIVHNGIIENFEILKKDLVLLGAEFISETDSELIAHKLNLGCGSPLNRMADLFDSLNGSFAVVALFNTSPNKIYAITKKSPLIVGRGKDCVMVASDVTALIGTCTEIYRMNDNEVLVFDNLEVCIYDKNLKPKKIIWNKLHNTMSDISLIGYDSYMEKEIFEIP